ncbi:hypothetical protein F4678DRAFT_438108 [Xylaria arbuscula]|nr:hypothetical protein F4678DRAFT_438108 [Xylaria arbuscula]
MDFWVHTCVFCGWYICGEQGTASWANQFRGLYRGPTGLTFTGVGIYNYEDGAFIAPISSHARWDDEGYNSPMEDRFGTMVVGEQNGRRGFVFHDACWRLLRKALPGRVEPALLERLFEVLSSVSISLRDTSFRWGPDFGGIENIECHGFLSGGPPDRLVVHGADPCNSLEAGIIRTETSQSPTEGIVPIASVGTSENDLFKSLPLEIRLAITMCLSTSDALNARLASRAFWPVFHDQLFWMSRFKDAADRAWFFEALEWRRTIDWRWIYRRTRTAHIGPALRNRQRIWSILRTVVDIIGLQWYASNLPTSDSLEPKSSYLAQVIGNLWQTSGSAIHMINSGCRLSHRYYVTIPNNLLRFSISYIQICGVGYVSGIKFTTTTTGSIVQLGYWTTTEYSIHLTEIWGFILAVGSRGIQAVKCLTASDATSCWLGYPDGALKTTRLAVFDTPLDSLVVGFDAFKMVSLATTKTPMQTPEDDSLRSLGLWYPDVPGSALSLNESSFMRPSDVSDGHNPLFWATFGGPGGKYLKHLIQISVTIGGGLRRIDFTYDINVPAEHRSFGHCPPRRYFSVVDFVIDGPGGEIINAIELDYFHNTSSSMEDYWGVYSCKMSTNHARSCLFTSKMGEKSDHITRVVELDPKATITGFYASEGPNGWTKSHGFRALGVISEIIGEQLGEQT